MKHYTLSSADKLFIILLTFQIENWFNNDLINNYNTRKAYALSIINFPIKAIISRSVIMPNSIQNFE